MLNVKKKKEKHDGVESKKMEEKNIKLKAMEIDDNKNAELTSLPIKTKRLLDTQIEFFPKIIKELQKNGRKTSHWAWYVWPTTMPGRSDSRITAVTEESAYSLLKLTNLDQWIMILNLLAEYMENKVKEYEKRKNNAKSNDDSSKEKTREFFFQRNPISKIIPPIDHGRIKFFIQFWLVDNDKNITKQFPTFYNAIHKFNDIFEYGLSIK